jgi:hypothetical protein
VRCALAAVLALAASGSAQRTRTGTVRTPAWLTLACRVEAAELVCRGTHRADAWPGLTVEELREKPYDYIKTQCFQAYLAVERTGALFDSHVQCTEPLYPSIDTTLRFTFKRAPSEVCGAALACTFGVFPTDGNTAEIDRFAAAVEAAAPERGRDRPTSSECRTLREHVLGFGPEAWLAKLAKHADPFLRICAMASRELAECVRRAPDEPRAGVCFEQPADPFPGSVQLGGARPPLAVPSAGDMALLTIWWQPTATCAGGTFFVDGVEQGKYPIRRHPVPPGRHEVKIWSTGDCAGYGAEWFEFRPGVEITFDVTRFY